MQAGIIIKESYFVFPLLEKELWNDISKSILGSMEKIMSGRLISIQIISLSRKGIFNSDCCRKESGWNADLACL